MVRTVKPHWSYESSQEALPYWTRRWSRIIKKQNHEVKSPKSATKGDTFPAGYGGIPPYGGCSQYNDDMVDDSVIQKIMVTLSSKKFFWWLCHPKKEFLSYCPVDAVNSIKGAKVEELGSRKFFKHSTEQFLKEIRNDSGQSLKKNSQPN